MSRRPNRQPRAPRDQRPSRSVDAPRTHGTVPTTRHVIPGASVSIVLKADQGTGREVSGVVQDLLTHGDHPRGIKVRLQDGRVGRVQRMAEQLPIRASGNAATTPSTTFASDMNALGDHLRSPDLPRYSLANFIPAERELQNTFLDDHQSSTGMLDLSSATVICPFCNSFQGDEAAVSHHIEEHLI